MVATRAEVALCGDRADPLSVMRRAARASAWSGQDGETFKDMDVTRVARSPVPGSSPSTNSTGTWQSNSISWSGGPNNVVLRFVVVSNGGFARIKIDDVSVACVTFR
jgi:hypothetical protein